MVKEGLRKGGAVGILIFNNDQCAVRWRLSAMNTTRLAAIPASLAYAPTCNGTSNDQNPSFSVITLFPVKYFVWRNA